jgi:hypothetical protein
MAASTLDKDFLIPGTVLSSTVDSCTVAAPMNFSTTAVTGGTTAIAGDDSDDSSIPLVEYWRSRGYPYTEQEVYTHQQLLSTVDQPLTNNSLIGMHLCKPQLVVYHSLLKHAQCGVI